MNKLKAKHGGLWILAAENRKPKRAKKSIKQRSSNMSQREIDDMVVESMSHGHGLYTIDEALLRTQKVPANDNPAPAETSIKTGPASLFKATCQTLLILCCAIAILLL